MMGRAYHNVRATGRSGYIPSMWRGVGWRGSFGTFLQRKVKTLLKQEGMGGCKNNITFFFFLQKCCFSIKKELFLHFEGMFRKITAPINKKEYNHTAYDKNLYATSIYPC